MKSHHYEFSMTELGRMLLLPLLPVVVVAIAVRVLGGTLPSPCPLVDVDHTIISHQVDSCFRTSDADVLIVGDPSALMGIDAVRMSEALELDVLNLSTISYLSLAEYAAMMDDAQR